MQKDDGKKPRSGGYGVSTEEMLEHGNQMVADSGIPIQWEFSASKSIRTSLDRKSAVCPSCRTGFEYVEYDGEVCVHTAHGWWPKHKCRCFFCGGAAFKEEEVADG